MTALLEDGAGTIPLGTMELRWLMHLHLFPLWVWSENFQDKPAEKSWKSCACFCFGSSILSSLGRFLWVNSANLFISYWQITVSPVKPGFSVSPQCNSQMSDTVTAGLEPNWTGMLESFWSKSLWLWALCLWNDEVQQDDSNERALFRELDNSISVVLSFHLCSWVYCK